MNRKQQRANQRGKHAVGQLQDQNQDQKSAEKVEQHIQFVECRGLQQALGIACRRRRDTAPDHVGDRHVQRQLRVAPVPPQARPGDGIEVDIFRNLAGIVPIHKLVVPATCEGEKNDG